MRRPASIWLVVLWLAAYGAYGVWVAVGTRYWAPGVMAFLSLVAATGLALRRRWAQGFLYLVALLVVASWGNAVWIVARAGWPFWDATRTALALIPGALLVVVCVGSSVLVFRYFHRSST